MVAYCLGGVPEGAKSSQRKSPTLPDCVLASDNIEGGRHKQKILYVGSTKVGKAKELSNLMNVDREGGVTDEGELIQAGQNTIGGETEAKLSNVSETKITFFQI
jgi:hypothetical protein